MKTKKLSFLWAALGGALTDGAVLLLITALTVKAADPAAHMGILAALPWAAGAAVTGILGGWLGRDSSPVKNAAAAGGCYLLTLAVLSLLLGDGAPFGNLPLFLLQAVIVMGLAIALSLPFRNRSSRAVAQKKRIGAMRKRYA